MGTIAAVCTIASLVAFLVATTAENINTKTREATWKASFWFLGLAILLRDC